MTHTSHSMSRDVPQLFSDDLPMLPTLENVPLIRPDHEPDSSLFDWAVEAMTAAQELRQEVVDLRRVVQRQRSELALAHEFWNARRKGIAREVWFTVAAVVVAGVVLLFIYATP